MGDQSDDGIGRRQAEVRKQLGLTQMEMANRLGIPMRTLSDNERALSVPGGKVLTAYAALGISVDWVLTGQGRPFREETSVGAVDLAELHGSTRIAIAVFDATDVLDSYVVGSEERHRRARISLAPEIVDEMVPVRSLGLPDECRLFGFTDTARNRIALIDAQITLVKDSDYLAIIDGVPQIRRIQLVPSGIAVTMNPCDPESVVSVQAYTDIDFRGRVVGSMSFSART